MTINFIEVFNRNFRLILISIFLFLFLFTYYLEIIPVFEGKGYDGKIYYSIATNGINLILNKIQIGYYVFRSFPFIFFDILNIPETIISVVDFFRFFNFICIILSIIYYFRLAKYLLINEVITNIGFILLFFNFPILKLVNYYPLLTDHFSFSISVIGIYYTLNYKKWLILIILIALFTFPSLAIILLIINIFKRKQDFGFVISKKYYSVLIYLLYSALIIISILFFININSNGPKPINRSTIVNLDFLFISFLALVLYFSYIIYNIFNALKERHALNIDINFRFLTFFMFIIFLMYLVFGYFPKMVESGISSIEGYANLSLIMPFNFIVYHTFYFGVVVILYYIFLKDILRIALDFGFGYFMALIFIFIFMIQNESRMLTNLNIFLCIPLLVKMNSIQLNSKNVFQLNLGFLFFGFIQSRFFYKINAAPNMWKLMEDPNNFSIFPVQSYFMNFGPWVNYEMYYFQLLCFIIYSFFLVLILRLFKRKA